MTMMMGTTLYFSDTWSLEVVLLSASLPSSLTGADLAIFAALFTYVADVTTVQDRTFRVTMLDITYLLTMPTGVALGIVL